MRLGVTQRLWRPEEEARVLPLLGAMGVDGVAAVARRLWPVGHSYKEAAVQTRAWTDRLRDEGLDMAAVLDGVGAVDGALWGPRAAGLYARLLGVVELAGTAGCPVVVVGSPALRRGAWPGLDSAVGHSLLGHMQAVGDVARQCGVVVAIKAIPATFGADFWTSLAAVGETVAAIGNPHVQVALDSPAVWRDRDPGAALDGHVHTSPVFVASEPFGGAVLEAGAGRHRRLALHMADAQRRGPVPPWLIWDADMGAVGRQVGPVLRAQTLAVRALYAPALRAGVSPVV